MWIEELNTCTEVLHKPSQVLEVFLWFVSLLGSGELKSSLRSTSSFLDSRHDAVSPGMSTQLHTCINCINYCHLADKRKTTQLYTFVCLVHFEGLLMSRFLALLAFCFGARWDGFSRNRSLRTPWQNNDCCLSLHGEAECFISSNQILWAVGDQTVKFLYIVCSRVFFSLYTHLHTLPKLHKLAASFYMSVNLQR